jgi:hypothetical protein
MILGLYNDDVSIAMDDTRRELKICNVAYY